MLLNASKCVILWILFYILGVNHTFWGVYTFHLTVDCLAALGCSILILSKDKECQFHAISIVLHCITFDDSALL